MTDADRLATELGEDRKIAVSPTVIEAIYQIQDEKQKSPQEVLNLIRDTFYLATSKRREPSGRIIHFSVNTGNKGWVKLVRLRAINTTERKMIIAIDLPKGESSEHSN